MYRARLDLSAAVVEAMFGLYAVGLIPGLLIAGRVSDRIGRRPVVATAVALSMIAAVVLVLGSHGPAWLFAGRLIMGVASGCGFSAGSAWIKELSAPPYAQGSPGAGARRTGVAMTIGFGLGPLVAGAAAQWSPLPTVLPYLPQLVLAVGAAALLPGTPETGPRRQACRRPRCSGCPGWAGPASCAWCCRWRRGCSARRPSRWSTCPAWCSASCPAQR